MEMQSLSRNRILHSLLEALLLQQTTVLAQQSLLCILLEIGSAMPDDMTISIDQRFPLADLTKRKEPASENNDAGESEGEDEDDDNGDQTDEDDDDVGSEEESGGEEDDSDDGEAYSDDLSDDEDEDDDDNEEED